MSLQASGRRASLKVSRLENPAMILNIRNVPLVVFWLDGQRLGARRVSAHQAGLQDNLSRTLKRYARLSAEYRGLMFVLRLALLLSHLPLILPTQVCRSMRQQFALRYSLKLRGYFHGNKSHGGRENICGYLRAPTIEIGAPAIRSTTKINLQVAPASRNLSIAATAIQGRKGTQ